MLWPFVLHIHVISRVHRSYLMFRAYVRATVMLITLRPRWIRRYLTSGREGVVRPVEFMLVCPAIVYSHYSSPKVTGRAPARCTHTPIDLYFRVVILFPYAAVTYTFYSTPFTRAPQPLSLPVWRPPSADVHHDRKNAVSRWTTVPSAFRHCQLTWGVP